MFKVTVEATTEQDKAKLKNFLRHLCYSLTEDSDIRLKTIGFKWDGRSGGDDAYFGLSDRPVHVKVVE